MATLPSTAQHIQDEELTRYACEVGDRDGAARIRSHILACRQCEARLVERLSARLAQLSVSQGSVNRRESRALARGCASLQTLSPLSLEAVEARILDASPSGMGLLTPGFLEPGTILTLRSEASETIATVRYCQSVGDGTHKTGVQFVRRIHCATPKP